MTRYRRVIPQKCGVCGQDYIIDTERMLGFCGCGTIKIVVPSKELLKLAFQEIT